MMAQNGKLERKLTTIFSADVAGYSGLMERDEAGTMAELRETRRLLSVFIERYRGRVVNTAGDGLLAEFASVVEAVLCAIEVQRELAVVDSPTEIKTRMQYRIGINLGDVMVENGDLFGEGERRRAASGSGGARRYHDLRCGARPRARQARCRV
jgi:adenylate cyclase